MKKIIEQQKNIKHLLELVKKNFDLEIVPMVNTECVCSDDFGSWVATWGNAKVDRIYYSDERVYAEGEDYDELVENWIDNNYKDYPNFSDDELQDLAEEKVNNYEWKKVIVVRINPL